MKTYTVTFHRSYNYGAMLQAYALQQFLLSEGIDNEIIDYSEEKDNLFSPIRIDSKLIKLKCFIKRVKCFMPLKSAIIRFNEFYKRYLIKTVRINNMDELKKLNKAVYITGSDQVWNPRMYNEYLRPYYYLEFAPQNSIRVSYAASLGTTSNLKEDEIQQIGRLVQNYNMVSFRETKAYDVFSEFNTESYVHIDPVFLLRKDEWSMRFAKLFKQKIVKYPQYILCYDLIQDDSINVLIDELRKIYDLPIVILKRNPLSKLTGDKVIYNAGPLEFLNYIYYADYVVSTSFHGIAFSVLFEKNFSAIVTKHAPERILELLRKLDLEQRLWGKAYQSDIKYNINYTEVRRILEEERTYTRNYFNKIGKIYDDHNGIDKGKCHE